MFASKETTQRAKSHAPSRKSSTVSDGVRRTNNAPESTHFLQRYLGNNYVQSMASGGAPVIQRKCACGGTCSSCSGKESKGKRIQPKLTVGPANDVYEQEADRVAEQVMRMPSPSNPKGIAVKMQSPKISKYGNQHNASQIARQPEEEEAKFSEESLLSLKEVPGTSHKMSNGLETEIQSLRGRGNPLSPGLRAFFEPRFGHSFNHVRIHTSVPATKTTRALNARAYTLGNNIAFAPGEYRPETHAGRNLIAHELTHVVQQSSQVQTVMRACNCSAIGARNPTKYESTLKKHFPNLVSGDWCVSAPASKKYNCVAWSIGDTSRWIDKEVDSKYGDKDGSVSISDFDRFYQSKGFTAVTNSTPAKPDIVLYSAGSDKIHVAPKSPHPCGFAFESKLGKNVRIIHDGYQLEGGAFGKIKRYYVWDPYQIHQP